MAEVKEVGIIGSGKMGTDIFNYLSDFDLKIDWVCSRSADPDVLFDKFKKKIGRNLRNGIITEEFHNIKIDKINISKDIGILKNCDLLIECITENFEEKKRLFVTLDGFVNPLCIFTSNTSSFKPSSFLSSLKRKDKFVCLHFFYPLRLKDMVEMVRPEGISEVTNTLLEDFLKMLNMTVLKQNEESAFILNRIFLEIQVAVYDAFCRSNKTVAELDDLVKKSFSSFGAFELVDNVGVKTILTSVKEYVKNYENKERYRPFLECLEKIDEKGVNGFYDPNFKEDEFKERRESLDNESIKKDIENAFSVFMAECEKKQYYLKSEIGFSLKRFLGKDLEEFSGQFAE